MPAGGGGAPLNQRDTSVPLDVLFGRLAAEMRQLECDGLRLEARIEMPPAGREEETVVETGNPYLWVAEPATRREGGTLIAATEIRHMEQKPFALDRSALTFTVLGQSHAVEIAGCG